MAHLAAYARLQRLHPAHQLVIGALHVMHHALHANQRLLGGRQVAQQLLLTALSQRQVSCQLGCLRLLGLLVCGDEKHTAHGAV